MDVVVIVMALLLIFVGLPLLTLALTVRTLRRSNRVSPKVPTFAPLLWLWLPQRPARLHRRLRRATAVARASISGGAGLPSMPELVGELERRACAADSKVVMASRMGGPARWSVLNEAEREVREVESLATRMAAMSSTWATTAVDTEAIAERLDALEQAMREVDEIANPQPPQLRRLS